MSIADLIEMLKKAEAGSRELDFWLSARIFDPSDESDEALQADIDLVGIDGMWVDAPFTASLDAAVALAGKVLPGWRGSIQFGDFGGPVNAYVCDDETIDDAMASHPVPAIALCIAILKAKQAEEQK